MLYRPAMRKKLVLVLNGPNLNMLGLREPAVYGRETLADVEKMCKTEAARLGLAVDFRQTNFEGELVTWIQRARGKAAGLVINPGGYSHNSVAIPDAIAAAEVPTVEVHLTNIHRREAFRHHSYVSAVAQGVLCGFGPQGYVLALQAVARIVKKGSP